MMVEEPKIITQTPTLSDQERMEMDTAVNEYISEQEAIMQQRLEERANWMEETVRVAEAVAEGQQDIFLPTSPDLEWEMENQAHLDSLEAKVSWSDLTFPTNMLTFEPLLQPRALPFVMVDQRSLKYKMVHTRFTPPYDQSRWFQGIGGGIYTIPDKSRLEAGKLGTVGPMKATHPLKPYLSTYVCSYLITEKNLVEMDIRFKYRTQHNITIVGAERCYINLWVYLANSIIDVDDNCKIRANVERTFYREILNGNKIWQYTKPQQTLTVTINLKVPNVIKPPRKYGLETELGQQLFPSFAGSGSLWTPVDLLSIDVLQFCKP